MIMKKYTGIVIHVAYIANDPERDHVVVLLPNGVQVSCYRCEVMESREGI